MPFGLDLLKATGGQAAGGFVSEGLGLLTQGLKNRQQFKQAKKLQGLQIEGSKELTDYNMAKQLQMWKDTSYGAQVEQMNMAGINPAIMYGMGGGGGQTAGNASGSVSGQSAGTAQKSSGGEGMGLMIAQMGLMSAQKANIEADTKLKEVDAAKKSGVDTENVKANTGLVRQQEEIAKVQASVSRQTIKEQMKSWENLISKQEADIKAQGLANKLSETQLNDKVQLLKNQVAVEAMKTALMSSEINRNNVLNKVSDAEWQNLIQQLWLDRDKFSEEKLMNTWKRWAIQNDIGDGNDSPDIVLPIMGSVKDLLGSKKHTPVTGFRR